MEINTHTPSIWCFKIVLVLVW